VPPSILTRYEKLPGMNKRQNLQYVCGLCNTVLKESEYLDIDPRRITEPCPSCGHSLASTLTINRLCKPAESVVFQVPAPSRALTFDIPQLDRAYSGIRAGEILCILGRPAITLVTRLCVRAMLPWRQGGLQSRVLFIDAGNTSDIYQCVNFARQYGMDLSRVLDSILVSRAFTIHQLASLIILELPEAIKRFGARLVVVSGLLSMFFQDPSADKTEAKRLLREMMAAVRRVSGEAIVVISSEETQGYEDIFAKFKNKLKLHAGGTLRIVASSEYGSKEFVLPEKALKTVRGE
jgi:hypothetical protein